MRLAKKVAIITGAASGMGRASALLFAREGAKVAVADINDEGGQETVAMIKENGGEAIFVHTDVSKTAEIKQLIHTTIATFGKLDILFNNAGMPERAKAVETIEEAEWDRIYAVNVKSIFLGAKYAIPEMKKNGGGVIINTASAGAVRVRPWAAAYTSSKGAAITLTRSLAIELARFKIRVNCINPVAADTPMMPLFMKEGVSEEDIREALESTLRTIPFRRLAQPEDIAYAALYLASNESSMVTGAQLNVDGGRCL